MNKAAHQSSQPAHDTPDRSLVYRKSRVKEFLTGKRAKFSGDRQD